MSRHITISGTDRSNPRNAAQVVEQLQQIAASVDALAEHAGKLHYQTSAVRDVLLDQGRSPSRAMHETQVIGVKTKALWDLLEQAKQAADVAARQIAESGVHPTASFEWRPGVPGKRGGLR